MRTFYFILILLIVIITGCTKEPENNSNFPKNKSDFSKREGRHLFIHYCSPCHGENGDGYGQYFAYGLEPQPADFTAADFLQSRNDKTLFLSISHGSAALGKSNLCPPWGNTFHQEEIAFLIDYIKILYKNENVEEKSEEVNNND
jgi:mono/diheme cytochrome c family protein